MQRDDPSQQGRGDPSQQGRGDPSQPWEPARHGAHARRRDRHGRGLRRPIAPRGVPLARSRGELFDDFVLDAVEELEQNWAAELAGVEFAVEDVPDVAGPQAFEFDPDVVVDHGIPLARLYRSGTATSEGMISKPVIVVYRRPVEARTLERFDRADLVFAVVTELVAEYLGKDVDEIDPPR